MTQQARRLQWLGKPRDFARLTKIIDQNCEMGCVEGTNPQPNSCPVHDILHDQAKLSHFDFVGSQAARLRRSEGLEDPGPKAA